MMTAQARTGQCPPLDPDRKRVADYQPTGAEPGHDGQKPEFVTRREHPWVGGKREATDSNFNVNHSRICWLFTHGRISQRQYDAAERLARDWEKSQIQPAASTVMVGNGGSGGSAELPQDMKVRAMQRHGAAIKFLGGHAPLVQLVVEENRTVEKAGALLGIHNRQVAMGRFETALDFLAGHYGL